jgi:hypothetical protein
METFHFYPYAISNDVINSGVKDSRTREREKYYLTLSIYQGNFTMDIVGKLLYFKTYLMS